MVNRKTALKIRKTHRYLGVFLGLQFLIWTISGLYFSWTNIDKIHGDHFRKEQPKLFEFDGLMSPSLLEVNQKIKTISLRTINSEPFYFINNSKLFNAKTGKMKHGISKDEALSISQNYIKKEMQVKDIRLIKKVNNHNEYREKLLPAYVISYKGSDALNVYISQIDGRFQTVRHKKWRWFDFLWMTHTMDYEGRDNINTLTLRIFSLLGLITVLSGFLLWFITSPTMRKINKKFKNIKK
jgi:hypothetical protein